MQIAREQIECWHALYKRIEQCEQGLEVVIAELSQPDMLEVLRRQVLGDISQARLGKLLGISATTVSMYESGMMRLGAKHAMRLLAEISDAQSAAAKGNGNEQ